MESAAAYNPNPTSMRAASTNAPPSTPALLKECQRLGANLAMVRELTSIARSLSERVFGVGEVSKTEPSPPMPDAPVPLLHRLNGDLNATIAELNSHLCTLNRLA